MLLEEWVERRVSMDYVVAFVGVVVVRGFSHAALVAAVTQVAWYVYARMGIVCREDMTHYVFCRVGDSEEN